MLEDARSTLARKVIDGLTDSANQIAIMLNLVMIFNFAFANWSINPIEDLLYVRSDGFLLPANHISSALALTSTTAIFQLRDWRKATNILFVIYSTASIHEYILDAFNIPAMLAAHTLGYTLTFRWVFWLALFLVIGLKMSTREQKKKLAIITAFCAVYIGGWVFLATTFNIDTYTILYYAPGPAFHDFIPNFFEVSSWVIPALIWWL